MHLNTTYQQVSIFEQILQNQSYWKICYCVVDASMTDKQVIKKVY